MRRFTLSAVVPVIVAIAFLTVGCETSSHRVVRTYEYNENPPRQEAEQELSEDQYKMQSPGKMGGPGHMVPPGSQHPDHP